MISPERELLSVTPPLSELAPELLDDIAGSAESLALPEGRPLFAAGDEADALFIVAEGRLRETIPGAEEILVAELGPRRLAGEVQVLTGGKRVTTVRAATDSRLVRIPKRAIDALTARDRTAAAVLNAAIRHRLRHDRFAAILVELFGALTARQLEDIIAAGKWITLPQGQDLMRQDDPSDSFCVLINGLLGVSVRTPEGGHKLINRMYSGEIVGEMAILTDDRRAATVFAIRESTLVKFPRDTFFDLAHTHPAFLLRIARLNIERLRRATGTLREAQTTTIVSLVPLSPAIPIAELAQQLAAELADYCTVMRVDAAAVDRMLGVGDAAQAPPDSPLQESFLTWLTSRHGACRIILLEADARDSNWTRSCIRQSDQMVMVALASENPAPGPLEALMGPARDAGVPQRLVLLHPPQTSHPTHTNGWLAPRRVEMHHHVRIGSRDDLRRLARFLNGSAVCLALGGGGARAFAQIGALRAFHDAGVAIDMIAGTSMGAVMGAEYALGVPPENMVTLNRDMFQTAGLVRDLTLPLLSFTTGRSYVAKLKTRFGDLYTEDLWIPFICLSSNISRAQMVMHKEGPLWRNLRATSSVQGLFPPVVIGGELHVDGALFSNLPADVLKSLGAGRVIAVDVTPPVDLAKNSDYGDSVSGWWILWQRLFRTGVFRVADIGTVLQRAAEAASMANQRQVIEKAADFYLRMPVEHIGLLDFSALDELARIGYTSATEKLPEWQASPRWVKS